MDYSTSFYIDKMQQYQTDKEVYRQNRYKIKKNKPVKLFTNNFHLIYNCFKISFNTNVYTLICSIVFYIWFNWNSFDNITKQFVKDSIHIFTVSSLSFIAFIIITGAINAIGSLHSDTMHYNHTPLSISFEPFELIIQSVHLIISCFKCFCENIPIILTYIIIIGIPISLLSFVYLFH